MGTHADEIAGAGAFVEAHEPIRVPLFSFPKRDDVLVTVSGGMAVVLEMIFVLSVTLLIKLPGVPVAVHGDSLRPPMSPNAEFSVAEPFGTMVLGQGFHGGLEWTGRDGERACIARVLG